MPDERKRLMQEQWEEYKATVYPVEFLPGGKLERLEPFLRAFFFAGAVGMLGLLGESVPRPNPVLDAIVTEMFDETITKLKDVVRQRV